MKVLVVCSGNSGQLSPFIKEQVDYLIKNEIQIAFFLISGKGILGYLSNLKKLKKTIRAEDPDIIHAHYGLTGFLSMLVKGKYPLITTFHGNDINPPGTINTNKWTLNRILSRLAYDNSDFSIFVNSDFETKLKVKKLKHSVIPSHIDGKSFYPIDKVHARNQLGLSVNEKYILFSSSFNNTVKNFNLAKAAVSGLNNIKIIELKGYDRQQVNLLLNACDLALLTSLNEGSPQFIKEAMACNCPIVSTNVGDVKDILGKTQGCYITSFDPVDVKSKIAEAFEFVEKFGRTNGREWVMNLGYNPENLIPQIIEIYYNVSR